MIVNNKKDLEKLLRRLNKNVGLALNDSVSSVVKKAMKDEIVSEVYEVYTPVPPEDGGYQRQKEQGGLIADENIVHSVIGNTTLIVENIRSDDGVNVAEVVESGQGYQFDFPYNGVPRPFTAATKEQLENTGVHKHALFKGLKRQGIDVEVK